MGGISDSIQDNVSTALYSAVKCNMQYPRMETVSSDEESVWFQTELRQMDFCNPTKTQETVKVSTQSGVHVGELIILYCQLWGMKKHLRVFDKKVFQSPQREMHVWQISIDLYICMDGWKRLWRGWRDMDILAIL